MKVACKQKPMCDVVYSYSVGNKLSHRSSR
jgi:hypothetical protein